MNAYRLAPSSLLRTQRLARLGAAACGLALTACTAPPKPPAPEPTPAPAPSPAPASAAPAPRLIFAGFAMHSQSDAFRNDVLAAEKLAREIDPNALMLKLGNPTRRQTSDWPQATQENLELVMTKVAEVARPQDRLLLLISTHANPGTLNVQAGGKNLPPLTAQNLSAAMASVQNIPTIVVLSACYSGSFVKPLQAPNRVVLAATDVNRMSFKCQYPAEHTYFGNALFGQDQAAQRSVAQWMGTAQKAIEAQEKHKRMPASRPIMAVGDDAKGWAQRPLKDWLQPYEAR